MINITPKQHSKILGFAFIAYSLQFSIKALDVPLFLIRGFPQPEYVPFSLYLTLPFSSSFSPFWNFLIGLLSGILIIYSKGIISSKDKVKYLSLLFVFLNLNIFPVGTILSFYTLWYLFKISDNKIEIEQKNSKET
jgi:hypothetical protein